MLESDFLFYRLSDYIKKFQRMDGRLMVRGKEIAGSIPIYHNYADLPFQAVMEALRGTMHWESETQAEIGFKGKTYDLDIDKRIIQEQGTARILPFPAPGGPFFMYVSNDELYMESTNLYIIFKWMFQENIRIEVDRCMAEAVLGRKKGK